ncbi:serine hydrolase domain-containing protein [Albibacterium profundi]|uniref:Serine hydrolase domain-containing protein n=1 Tax=Albibacterium profundi TaxID=3134906 RepID=A0ABV5CA28_9SPHI
MDPHTPGYALCVIKNGQIIDQKFEGLADLSVGSNIQSQTVFRMASVSKQFTAMVILMLAEKGLLSLEDRLNDFLGDCCSAYQDVTLKHLLTHTSGIWDYEPLISANQKEQLSDHDAWLLVNFKAETYFKPGERFKYSNTAYCILTLVAEHVAEKPYDELIHEMLFVPLGMRSSMIYNQQKEMTNRALGYAVLKDGFRMNDQSITSATKGDGCVYTSIEDYQRWHHSFYHHVFLSSELFKESTSAQVEVNNGMGYGYGWFVGKEVDGTDCFFHSGETSGFMNIVYHNLEKRLMISVFTNRNDNLVSEVFENAAKKQAVQLAFEGVNASKVTLFEWLAKQYMS